MEIFHCEISWGIKVVRIEIVCGPATMGPDPAGHCPVNHLTSGLAHLISELI